MGLEVELVGSRVGVVIFNRPLVHVLLKGLEHAALEVDLFTWNGEFISTKFSLGLR